MLHKLKVKFDKLFDDVFFSKEFKNFILENTGYCPNGLTFDTNINDKGVPEFMSLCKEYGYDCSGERVIGDYTLGKTPTNMEQLTNLMLEYLKENKKDLYDEIINYSIYFINNNETLK